MQQDLIIKIALAIQGNKYMSFESLLTYLNSYDCRIVDKNKFYNIILNNIDSIQFQMNNKNQVCMK